MTEKTLTAQQIVDDLLKPKIGAVQPPVKKVAAKEKLPVIKEKHYYDVKVETTLPATLTYRVLAEDAQQAAVLIKGMSPVSVKHRLAGKRDIKLSVYRAGTSMMEWARNLLG